LDIKPANVYLRNDGSPLLLDFGAARYTLSEEGVKLPPTYTPGYASPEQHLWRDLLGPWSDIYSVGATMYATLGGGEPPQAAHLRVEKDAIVPARRAWAGSSRRRFRSNTSAPRSSATRARPSPTPSCSSPARWRVRTWRSCARRTSRVCLMCRAP